MNWFVAAPAGLASGVEFVEAFTIVLAVGVSRGWRSSLAGTGAACVVLAAIVAVLGVALLRLVPLEVLRALVGVFLLLFGLKWLRKAILRYAGWIALHDESEIYQRELNMMQGEGAGARRRFDWVGATTSFNAVLLEGLEVVFIVIALGSAARAIGSAAFGAFVAGLIVVAVGSALHHPLSTVPENTLKFVVGIMLTAFGTFWAGEGAGVSWWHADLSLLPLIAGYLAFSFVAVVLLRRKRERILASRSG